MIDTEVSGVVTSVQRKPAFAWSAEALIGRRAADMLLAAPPDLFAASCPVCRGRAWVRDPAEGPVCFDIAAVPLPDGGVRASGRDASARFCASAGAARRQAVLEAVRRLLTAAGPQLPAAEALRRLLDVARDVLRAEEVAVAEDPSPHPARSWLPTGAIPAAGALLPSVIHDVAQDGRPLLLVWPAAATGSEGVRGVAVRRLLRVSGPQGAGRFDGVAAALAGAVLEMAIALEVQIPPARHAGCHGGRSAGPRLLALDAFLQEVGRRRTARAVGALLLVQASPESAGGSERLLGALRGAVRAEDILAQVAPGRLAAWLDGLEAAALPNRTARLCKALADAGAAARLMGAFAVDPQERRTAAELLGLAAGSRGVEGPARLSAGSV
ncbi:MAG: hypothetical protein ACK4ST_14880 [Elioraea tepidiphila]